MAILIAAVPFVLLLCALPAEIMARKIPFPQLMPRRGASSGTARGWQIVLAALLLLILAQLLMTKVADKPALVFCVACGALAGFIAWRLSVDAEENETPFLAASGATRCVYCVLSFDARLWRRRDDFSRVAARFGGYRHPPQSCPEGTRPGRGSLFSGRRKSGGGKSAPPYLPSRFWRCCHALSLCGDALSLRS